MKYFFYFFAFVLISCDSGPTEELVVGEALGTTYSIKYYSEEDVNLEVALDSIFERVNQSMSTYHDDSDISRINRGDSSVVVDSLFREVFELSQQVYSETSGYFDPTVGNLVNFYGFGPERMEIEVDSTTVDSLMNFVGLEKINISGENLLQKQSPEIYLDFNAIAKGYAVDLVGHYLTSKGVDNFLIEIGGELLASGKNLEKNDFWVVGIDDPAAAEGVRELKAAVEMSDRAMATSGNYRKNRLDPATGRMFVHTINPLTGHAEKSDILSASVLAENCALADAYATAFMAMGLDRTKEVLENLENVDVYLIYATEDGGTDIFLSPGFEEALVEL